MALQPGTLRGDRRRLDEPEIILFIRSETPHCEINTQVQTNQVLRHESFHKTDDLIHLRMSFVFGGFGMYTLIFWP